MIQIGPLALQAPRLVILVGFWLALELASRQGIRRGLDQSVIQNAGLYGILAGIAGARLGYVLQYWSVYKENLLGILSLSPQTLAPAEGLTVGLLVAGVHFQRRGVPFRPLLDAIAPGLAVLVSAVALANFFSGEAFGAETSVPWAIELWGARRHPTQLYELATGLAMLGVVLWAGREAPAPGLLFLLFVALYAGARLLLEPFRANSLLILGGLRAVQVAGLAAVLAALGLMRIWSVGWSTSQSVD
jgi:phosphatidylglycerol:prolipoprotein diacylglycerol transferase